MWEGLTNREIAKIIGTTEQVVKNYLRTAFDKLGVWSRLELALYVANHGGASWASSPADVKPQAEAEPQAAAWPTPSGSTRSGQGWVVEPTGGLENEGKDFTTKGTKVARRSCSASLLDSFVSFVVAFDSACAANPQGLRHSDLRR